MLTSSNISLFYLSILLIVAKGEDKCGGYEQDKLLINGRYSSEHDLYLDYGSTAEFHSETCNKTILKPVAGDWELTNANGNRKPELLDHSTNVTIQNVTYEHSGNLTVRHGNMYAYLRLKVCPQIDFIVQNLLVDCTTRSRSYYKPNVTCATNHTAYHGDDCNVRINFAIGFGGTFGTQSESCATKLCHFNLCQNQECYFLLESKMHQFQIRYDVVIYGEEMRAQKSITKALSLYETYEPNFNIKTVEVIPGGITIIVLDDSELFSIVKTCNFEVDIIDSEGNNHSNQTRITSDKTTNQVKIVISNLNPNTEYIFRVRIRSDCKGKFGKWSTDRIITIITEPTEPKTNLILEMIRILEQKLVLLIHDHPHGEKFGSGFGFKITINNSTMIDTKHRVVEMPNEMLSNKVLHVQAACQNDIGPCNNIVQKQFMIGQELNIYTTTAVHQFKDGIWATTFVWEPEIPNLERVRIFYCKSKQPIFDCDTFQFGVESFSIPNPVIHHSEPNTTYSISFCFESACSPMVEVTYSQRSEEKAPKVNLDAHYDSRDSTVTLAWLAQDFGLINSYLIQVQAGDQLETIEEIPKFTNSSNFNQYVIKIPCDRYKKYIKPQFTVSTVTSFLGHKTVGEPTDVYQNCWVDESGDSLLRLIMMLVGATLSIAGVAGITVFCCIRMYRNSTSSNQNCSWFGYKLNRNRTRTDSELNSCTENGHEMVPLTNATMVLTKSYPPNNNGSATGATFNGTTRNGPIQIQLCETSNNLPTGPEQMPYQDQIRPNVPTEPPPPIPTAYQSSLEMDVGSTYEFVDPEELDRDIQCQSSTRTPQVIDDNPETQQPLLESCESPSSIHSLSSTNGDASKEILQ